MNHADTNVKTDVTRSGSVILIKLRHADEYRAMQSFDMIETYTRTGASCKLTIHGGNSVTCREIDPQSRLTIYGIGDFCRWLVAAIKGLLK